MQISDSLRKKLDFIKSHVPASHGVIKLYTEEQNPITPEEAYMLYNLDDDTYIEEVGIKKALIYFFLSDEKKLEYAAHLKYFNDVGIRLLNFLKSTCQNEATFNQLFSMLVSNQSISGINTICLVLEDLEPQEFRGEILKIVADTYLKRHSLDQRPSILQMLKIDVSQKDKTEILAKIIKNVDYSYDCIFDSFVSLDKEDQSYILNTLLDDPTFIKATKLIDMLEYYPYNERKNVVFNFLKKHPDNVSLLSTLEDDDVIEAFKDSNMSHTDLLTYLNGAIVSDEFIRKLYDAIVSDKELEKRYFNEEFVAYIDEHFDSSEMEEIFANKVLPSEDLTP